MTELEQLLSEALASQSEQVASLAERLNALTVFLEVIQEEHRAHSYRVEFLMELVNQGGSLPNSPTEVLGGDVCAQGDD